MALGGSSSLVADDVRIAKAVRLNVAVIGGAVDPTHYRRLVRVPRHGRRIIASKGHTVGDEPVDMSVGRDFGGRVCESKERRSLEESHCERLVNEKWSVRKGVKRK
jgi:hypothetical protein